MSTFNAPKIEQVGEWVIGWRDGMIGDTGWSMWWGHESTDEELGCGNLMLSDESQIIDYDGFGEPPVEVWEAVLEAGYGLDADLTEHVMPMIKAKHLG